MRKNYYYCDMDGVLADFNTAPNNLSRFATEKGFFKGLAPIQENINYIKRLVERGENVHILSASPNAQADQDKKEWLKMYMPFIKPRQIILMRNGENKADYVRSNGVNILFDDYKENCKQWNERAKHIALKVETTIAAAKVYSAF